MHPFFGFFNQNRPFIDPDSAKWHREWKTIRWKSYSNCECLNLPKPNLPNVPLRETILKRRSQRDFSGASLDIGEISNLLFFACGLIKPDSNLNNSRRPQPSGGGLYPIEIYLLVFVASSEEIPPGIYHYNVLGHCLEKLPGGQVENLKSAFHYRWVDEAGIVMLFSFIENRAKPKYGNLAYKVGLIEAGHIGQNVYLNCAAMDLKCCALGNLEADMIHQALGLDGRNEVVFYSIAIGK